MVATWWLPLVYRRAPRGIKSSSSPSGSVGVRRIVACACRNGRGRPSSSPSRLSASPRAEETNWLSYIAARAAQVRASSSAVTSRILRIADPEVRSTSLPNTVRASASFSASSRANGLGTKPPSVEAVALAPVVRATSSSIAWMSIVVSHGSPRLKSTVAVSPVTVSNTTFTCSTRLPGTGLVEPSVLAGARRRCAPPAGPSGAAR